MANAYAFQNSWQHAYQRLRSLEGMADSGSLRHLEATGIGEGWRCLEVGAGAGSIARWMSERVGSSGHVLATDINPRFLEPSDNPPLEVREHDITADPLPEEAFDLVHARMVLAHLSDREEVLDRLAGALTPGGWLVVEELDFAPIQAAPENPDDCAACFDRMIAAHHAVMEARGFDPYYGRCLLDDLRQLGLADVETEGRAVVCHGGGNPWALAWRYTCQQLRDDMIATGLITPAELDLVIAQLDDSEFSFLSQLIVAAWGRKAT